DSSQIAIIAYEGVEKYGEKPKTAPALTRGDALHRAPFRQGAEEGDAQAGAGHLEATRAQRSPTACLRVPGSVSPSTPLQAPLIILSKSASSRVGNLYSSTWPDFFRGGKIWRGI